MAISLVQKTSSNEGAVNVGAQAFPSNNTLGNLLVACVRYGPARANVGLTDSKNNTWLPVVDLQASNTGVFMFYVKSCKAGANTVTVTADGTATSMRLSIAEYSGADPNPLDVTTTGTHGTSTQVSLPLTTNFDGSLLVIAHGTSSQSVATAGSVQYTVEETQQNFFAYTDGYGVTAGDEIGLVNLATAVTWTALMAAFKPLVTVQSDEELVACEEPIGEFWDLPPYPMQQPKKGIAHLVFGTAGTPPFNRGGLQNWPAYYRVPPPHPQPRRGKAHQNAVVSDPFIFSGPRVQDWRVYARPDPQVRAPFVRVADLPAQGPVQLTGQENLIVKNLRRGRR